MWNLMFPNIIELDENNPQSLLLFVFFPMDFLDTVCYYHIFHIKWRCFINDCYTPYPQGLWFEQTWIQTARGGLYTRLNLLAKKLLKEDNFFKQIFTNSKLTPSPSKNGVTLQSYKLKLHIPQDALCEVWLKLA